MQFNGKSAVVVGGAGAIGFELCRQLLKENVDVSTIHYISLNNCLYLYFNIEFSYHRHSRQTIGSTKETER